ncbi:MAG: hypothetical protein ABIO36_08840 [Pyrinomonadaceae bacterium]
MPIKDVVIGSVMVGARRVPAVLSLSKSLTACAVRNRAVLACILRNLVRNKPFWSGIGEKGSFSSSIITTVLYLKTGFSIIQ